jgi:hypothetical protein
MNKKVISVSLVLIMLLSMLVPMSASAETAATTYTPLKITGLPSGTSVKLQVYDTDWAVMYDTNWSAIIQTGSKTRTLKTITVTAGTLYQLVTAETIGLNVHLYDTYGNIKDYHEYSGLALNTAVSGYSTPTISGSQAAGFTVAFTAVGVPTPTITPAPTPTAERELVLNPSGYTTGFVDGTFRPDATITRYEIATLLYRAVYGDVVPDAEKALPFVDLGGYTQTDIARIARLYELGVINGRDDTHFEPGAPVTREEVLTMVIRAFYGKNGVTTEWTPINGIDPVSDKDRFTTAFLNGYSLGSTWLTPFKDVPYTRWSSAAIAFGAYKGLVNGYEDGTFMPVAKMTRAEAVTLINRSLGYIPDLAQLSSYIHQMYDSVVLIGMTDVREDYWAYADIVAALFPAFREIGDATVKPVEPGESNITVSGFTLPTILPQGRPYSIRGSITSNYVIRNVTFTIGDELTVTKKVNSTTFNIADIDNEVTFGVLTSGYKTLDIIVEDVTGFKLFSYPFEVR